MTVTRPVIIDLWPAYASGEASAETRALVEEFLRDDPELARQLREDPLTAAQSPSLPPDSEVDAFTRARRRLRGYPWLLKIAMLFSALSFARIVSDTSWDVSPRQFIITAGIAVAFWIAFFVTLWRMRATIMVVPGRKPARPERAENRSRGPTG
jgi:anti-sigma factor RsiW